MLSTGQVNRESQDASLIKLNRLRLMVSTGALHGISLFGTWVTQDPQTDYYHPGKSALETPAARALATEHHEAGP